MKEPSLFPEAVSTELPRLCVGTSGYSFRDWAGPFYPPGVPARRHLEYYAGRFPCLEVNVSHYRLPDARLLRRMVERTPERFGFIVKLYQAMTHGAAPRVDAEEVRSFVEALEPMRQSGKLHGVLAQFPFGFRNTKTNRGHLSRLRAAFADVPFFAEFRHAGWIEDSCFDLLRREEIGYVCVDEPPLKDLVPPIVRATTDVGYVRLHGRNARTWYARRPEEGDRYDYLYSETELQEWAARIRRLIQETRRVFVLFNNCHAGKAPANAQAMKEILALLEDG